MVQTSHYQFLHLTGSEDNRIVGVEAQFPSVTKDLDGLRFLGKVFILFYFSHSIDSQRGQSRYDS